MDPWNTGDPGRREFFDQLSVVGKAFANPKRLEIIDLLARGEQTVEAIAAVLDLKTSTASAHLQILRLSNLVRTRREGQHVRYRLAGEDVATLFDQLHRVATTHSAEVGRALEAYLGTGEVDLVSHEELLRRMAADEVTVVDVREPHEYAAAHLPGAINIPFGQLLVELDRIDELGREREVVAYCRGAYCVLAHDAARLLAAHGRPVARMRDGIREWQLAGHPLEESA